WLSRSVRPGRKDAEGSARRRDPAAEGHAAGARTRPQARQPGAACRRRQRNDECLPRPRYRPQGFRCRARSLPPPGRTIMTSKAELFGAALGKAVKQTMAKFHEDKPPDRK